MSGCAEVHAGLVRGNWERPNSMADGEKAGGLGYRVEEANHSRSCRIEWDFYFSMSALVSKVTILMIAHRSLIRKTMNTLKAGGIVSVPKYHTCP